MALSSVAVVTNSLRLRSFDARPDAVRRAPGRGPIARLRRGWYLVAVAAASPDKPATTATVVTPPPTP